MAKLPRTQTVQLAALEAVLQHVPAKSKAFASDLVLKGKKYVLSEKQMFWVDKLKTDAVNAMTGNDTPAPLAEVDPAAYIAPGELAPIQALFDNAAAVKAKKPGFELGLFDGTVFRFRPGVLAANKGSIMIVEMPRTSFEHTKATGKITPAGDFIPSGAMLVKPENVEKITCLRLILKHLASDPVNVIAEYGRMTGKCTFCKKKLSQGSSLKVGYGADCAKKYGLPYSCN